MKWLLVTGILIGHALAAYPLDWYVDQAAVEPPDGRTWSTAFPALQPALDAASHGDNIHVAEGIYNESRPANGYAVSLRGSLVVPTSVTLIGGYSSDGGQDRLWDPSQFDTVIDGSKARNGGNANQVVFVLDGIEFVVLEGLTITAGDGRDASVPLNLGGGLHTDATMTTIRHCRFVANYGVTGGVHAERGSLSLEDCVFEGNSSKAVQVNLGHLVALRCRFQDNASERDGGAVSARRGNFEDCLFFSNAVDGANAGAVSGEDLTFTNCVFAFNTAARGGAIYVKGGPLDPYGYTYTPVLVRNCTFFGNTATVGGAMYIETANAFVGDSIFWNNGVEPLYLYKENYWSPGWLNVGQCIVEGGYAEPVAEIIDADPLFVDPANLDFRLLPGSPAIDAGTALDAPDFDIAGTPRPQGAGYDMGAYEYAGEQYTALALALDGEGTTDPAPGAHWYAVGAEATLLATPAEGWAFDGWTGDISSVDNPLTLMMTADTSVTAVFVPQALLTVGVDGSGTTDPAPGAYWYAEGAEVTLLATPAEGWAFDGWTGDVSGMDNPLTLMMDADTSVVAVFRLVEPGPGTASLVVDVQGEGGVEPTPQSYVHPVGAEVMLTATPAEGWAFSLWRTSTGEEYTQNPVTLTLTGDTGVRAVFVPERAPFGCVPPGEEQTPAGFAGLLPLAGLAAVALMRRRPRVWDRRPRRSGP